MFCYLIESLALAFWLTREVFQTLRDYNFAWGLVVVVVNSYHYQV